MKRAANELLKKSVVLLQILAVLSLLSFAATPPGDKAQSTRLRSGVYIEKYYVADSAPDSTYDTGALHIVYSDGTEVIQDLPPKKKSTGGNTVSNQEGFSDVQLAEDRLTLGWTETYDNSGTSYSSDRLVVVDKSRGC